MEQSNKKLEESELAGKLKSYVNVEEIDRLLYESENPLNSVNADENIDGEDHPSTCFPSSASSSSPPPASYSFPAFIPVLVPAYPPPLPSICPPYFAYTPSPYIPFPYPFPTHLPSPSIPSPDVKTPQHLAVSSSFKETCLEFIKLGVEISNQLRNQESCAAGTNAPRGQPVPCDMEAVLERSVELLHVLKEILTKSTGEKILPKSTGENEEKKDDNQKMRRTGAYSNEHC